MQTCRFRTTFGGTLHCQEETYQEGFCRFHFECLLNGQILSNGQINEKLADQRRRREINFHGIRLPDKVYVSE